MCKTATSVCLARRPETRWERERARERQRERESGLLLGLIYSINHSIWFLFIFRSHTVISAAHWALYALPRRFPLRHWACVPEHAFGHDLQGGERLQHFSDISRLLTFTVKSPQTCLSSNLQRADTQVNELHTYNELCQCCGAGSKRLQTHSSEELCIIILVNLANGARGRVCSLCMHVLSIETYRDICCSCLKSRFLPKPVRPAKTAFNTLYFTFNWNNAFTTNSHRFFRFSCEVESIF